MSKDDVAQRAIERLASLRRGKVVCSFVFPPIPSRAFDYCAHFDDDEPDDDGNMLSGFGKTVADALNDLADKLEQRID